MCPLVNELKKHPDFFDVKVCITGQHKQMLNQVLGTFGVKPDYNISIMKEKQTLFDITANVLNRIRDVFEREKPNLVLVHGDTTTTFVSTLSSFYL